METKHAIKTSDGKVIEGILRGSLDKPLILLVHGLCGSMNEAMHYNAARYFEKHGFASFRFNLYSYEKDNRKLHECTLKTHGKDIDTVLQYLQGKGIKGVYAIGHSYGFPSILHVTEKDMIIAIVSWDGSVLPRSDFQKLQVINEPIKGRLLDEGYMAVMGDAMVVEEGIVDSERLAKEFKKPIKFITIAEDGNLEGGRKLYDNLPGENEFTVIEGASHCFVEDGKQEELYEETVHWIRKFI